MGTWKNLFQASVRLASTGNMRGTPSLGSASRMATRTAPVQAADTFLKKSRRFGWVGVSVACIKSAATSPPPLLRTNHKRIPSKGKVELDDIVRFNMRKERRICSLKRESKANGGSRQSGEAAVPSGPSSPWLNFSACFSK